MHTQSRLLLASCIMSISSLHSMDAGPAEATPQPESAVQAIKKVPPVASKKLGSCHCTTNLGWDYCCTNRRFGESDTWRCGLCNC